MIPTVGMINRNILQNKDWNSFISSQDLIVYFVTPYEFNPNDPLNFLSKRILEKKGESIIHKIKELY